MKNRFKKLIAAVAAFAVAFTAVSVADVTTTEAATTYETLYTSGETAEVGYAGVENKVPFTVSKSGEIYFFVRHIFNSVINQYFIINIPFYIYFFV